MTVWCTHTSSFTLQHFSTKQHYLDFLTPLLTSLPHSLCLCPLTLSLSLSLTLTLKHQLGHAYDAQNREVALGGDHKADEVKGAETALELYNVIG